MLEKYNVRVESLGSSSGGNSFYLNIQLKNKKFGLLLECGFKYQSLLEKLYDHDINVSDIDVVLVSHEHDDHALGLSGLVNIGKKVYAPQTVYDKYKIDTTLSNVNIFDKEYTNKTIYKDEHDTIKVFGFPLEHYDANDKLVYNLGYVITINNEFRILFAIDTKYIKQDFSKYQFDLIFIETNYVGAMLRPAFAKAKEANNQGEIVRYNRIFNSHQSLEYAIRTLFGGYDKKQKRNIQGWDLSKTQVIILTHLSSSHGTNYQYYLNKFNIRKPSHVKVLVALKEGGLV